MGLYLRHYVTQSMEQPLPFSYLRAFQIFHIAPVRVTVLWIKFSFIHSLPGCRKFSFSFQFSVTYTADNNVLSRVGLHFSALNFCHGDTSCFGNSIRTVLISVLSVAPFFCIAEVWKWHNHTFFYTFIYWTSARSLHERLCKNIMSPWRGTCYT